MEIEHEKKKSKKKHKHQRTEENSGISNLEERENEHKGVNHLNEDNTEELSRKKKKKKKSKHNSHQVTNGDELKSETLTLNNEQIAEKSSAESAKGTKRKLSEEVDKNDNHKETKKKSKKATHDGDNFTENGFSKPNEDIEKTTDLEIDDSQKQKSKKKKKRKDKKGNDDLKELDVEIHEKSHKEKKVAKDQGTLNSEEITDEQQEEITEEQPLVKKQKKKHKKKKSRNSEEIEDDCPANENVDESSTSSKKDKTKKKTNQEKDSAVEEKVSGDKGQCIENENKSQSKKDITPDSCKIFDKSSTAKKVSEAQNQESVEVGQWSSANLGDSERQNKFLRLLGGFKKGNDVSQIQKFVFGQKRGFNENDNICKGKTGGGFAMDKIQEEKYKKSMENEYEKAMTMNLNRGIGLGFEKPPDAGKKFYIDTKSSKSIKFDD